MKSVGTIFSTMTKSVLLCSIGLSVIAQASIACPCADLKLPSPPDKDFDIPGGLAFMKTKEYKKEFSDAVKDAYKACEKHVGESYVAIVSDIDETCLDNKEYFEKNNQLTQWGDYRSWIKLARDPVLKESADFLIWARKKGFAIFFITGRHEDERAATIENLVHAGLSYDGLYLKPNGDKEPAEAYKSRCRKEIADLGFKIVLTFGDQYSDLTGGYAENCVKLPNKIYYIK